MSNEKKYRGVIVPMVSVLTESLEIDYRSIDKYINFIVDTGTYPFVLGTTGEIASLTHAKKYSFIREVSRCLAGRSLLYAGITDNCIEYSIKAANDYAELGVNVLVAHLPYFYPLDNKLIERYFKKLASISPLPIIIYNIVSITHISIPIDIIDELSGHPNIVGLKDSERNWSRMEKLAERFEGRDDFSLFIGWTNKSYEALKIGFDGIIPNTGNIVPSLFRSLYDAVRHGHDVEAIDIQRKTERLSELVQNDKTMTRTIPELKSIMSRLNLCQPYVLPPLEMLSDSEASDLFDAFIGLNLEQGGTSIALR
jgi:dihydrodipicolinate synthase/N-acetylneuraminate lyase